MTNRYSIAVFLMGLLLGSSSAQDFNKPGPIQKFGAKGWLLEEGQYKDLKFRAYLETERPLLSEDATYYLGTYRVEGGEGGTIRWTYKARCTVHPDLAKTAPLGVYVSGRSRKEKHPEQFIEVDKANTSPPNAERGWYQLWWAVCTGELKKF